MPDPQAPDTVREHLRRVIEILGDAIRVARPGADRELVIPMHLAAAARNRVEAAMDILEDLVRMADTTGPGYTQKVVRTRL